MGVGIPKSAFSGNGKLAVSCCRWASFQWGCSRRSSSKSARGSSAVTAISVWTLTPTGLSTASNRAPSRRCQRVEGGVAMTHFKPRPCCGSKFSGIKPVLALGERCLRWVMLAELLDTSCAQATDFRSVSTGHDHHFGQPEEPGLRFASSALSRLRLKEQFRRVVCLRYGKRESRCPG